MNPREGTNHDEDFILNLAAMLLMPLVSRHAAEVANLRCEYLKDPPGIDVAKPRLGWKIVISDQPPFPALRSGHRHFQRPSPEKQIPSSK